MQARDGEHSWRGRRGLCDKRLYVKWLRFRFRIMRILRREFFSILLRSFFVQEHAPVSPFLAIAFEVLSKEPYKEGLQMKNRTRKAFKEPHKEGLSIKNLTRKAFQ